MTPEREMVLSVHRFFLGRFLWVGSVILFAQDEQKKSIVCKNIA